MTTKTKITQNRSVVRVGMLEIEYLDGYFLAHIIRTKGAKAINPSEEYRSETKTYALAETLVANMHHKVGIKDLEEACAKVREEGRYTIIRTKKEED